MCLLLFVIVMGPIWHVVNASQTELANAEQVTLTLYVHETCMNGKASLAPLLAGASVSGIDGHENHFAETTNRNGYVKIPGAPGDWTFTASKAGYGTTTWSQEIDKTETKHACLADDDILGIDVSDATVDWKQVWDAGFKFAFVKSSAGTVEYSSFTERVKLHELEAAKKRGLKVGVYHIGMPCLNNPQSEAEAFIKIAKNYLTDGYLRPALDIEVYKYKGKSYDPSACRCKGATNLSDWVKKWMEYVYAHTDPHVTPILYTGS